MASRFRVFTKRFFIYLNIAVVFFFLLACICPYLNPQNWWFLYFLGLAFPFLLVFVVLFFVAWLLVKPKYALISLITLLIGFKSISVFIAFHWNSAFEVKKEAGTLRILDWNVARFVEMKRNNNKGSQTRLKMMELIKEQDADIICMQEFFHSDDSTYYPNLHYIKNNLGYPYYYYSHDNDGDKHFTGSIIFSRFPIIDSGLIRYPRPTLPEALMHADIVAGTDTVRVYTTHLQSTRFVKSDYQRISEIKHVDDSLLTNSRTIFSKLKTAVSYRSIQAHIIDQVLDDSPFPLIFCGDLNDIPNSFTYFTVRDNMQDAFLEKGSGIGRTFSALSPTLRIDYIFADNAFSIRQFKRVIKPYSDHYMLVSDIALKK